MTESRPGESRPVLEVTRIGGGPSARLVAVGVAGALAVVVLVGLVSRGPGEPFTYGPGAAAREAAAHFGVRATIGNSAYLATLSELQPNRLSATLRIPIPQEALSGTLTVNAASGPETSAETVTVGEWFLPLDALRSTSGEAQGVFVSYVSARPSRDDLAARFRDSFSIQVFAENDLLFGILSIELTLRDAAQITTS